jgi:hypothetical protein
MLIRWTKAWIVLPHRKTRPPLDASKQIFLGLIAKNMVVLCYQTSGPCYVKMYLLSCIREGHSHTHTKLITNILRTDDFQRVTDTIQTESFVSRLANVALNIRFGSWKTIKTSTLKIVRISSLRRMGWEEDLARVGDEKCLPGFGRKIQRRGTV